MFDKTKEVPSLELCRRLKELGYPQDGGWYWVKWRYWVKNRRRSKWDLMLEGKFYNYLIGNEIIETNSAIGGIGVIIEEKVKAPTLSEVMEWLPNEFYITKIMDYICANLELDPAVKGKYPIMHAVTGANAGAKMLIWLRENQYIKFEKAE